MALIKCPECGKEYSDKAAQCPNCACPTSLTNNNPTQTEVPETVKAEESNAGLNITPEEEQNPQLLYQKALELERQGEIDAAFSYISKGAELGNIDCLAQLGYCYLYGHGVTQNPPKAIPYLTKAAQKGQVNAQYNLGLCCLNGWGVSANQEIGSQWIQVAANNGHIKAKELLKQTNRNKWFGNGFKIGLVISFAGFVLVVIGFQDWGVALSCIGGVISFGSGIISFFK